MKKHDLVAPSVFRATASLLLFGLLSACADEITISPPVAHAQHVTAVEKSEIYIDASSSTAGTYKIESYSLSLLGAQSEKQTVLSSDAKLRVVLPAVQSSTTLHYALTVTDLEGNQSSTTVDVQVQAVDEAPLAFSESLTAVAGSHFNTTAKNNILLNDFDEADIKLTSSTLKAELVRAPAVVSNFKLSQTGDVSFDAPLSFEETSDSFTYRVSDGSGLFSEAVEVYLRLAPSGQTLIKPKARAASINGSEKSTLTIDASGSASGSFAIASYQLIPLDVPNSWNGQLPSSGVSSSSLFTIKAANHKQNTTLKFKLIVRDTEGNSDETEVLAIVSTVDETPSANADKNNVVAGEFLKVSDLKFSGGTLSSSPAGNLLLNDRDEPEDTAPSQQLKVQLISKPKYATDFYVNALGGYGYRSSENTTATSDSFSYRVLDANGASAATTVFISIKPSDSAPPIARAQSLTVDEKTNVTIDASASIAGDHAIVSYRLSSSSLPSGWSIPTETSSNHTINFKAGAIYSQTNIPLTLTVRDSAGKEDSTALTLTVNPVEETPIAKGEEIFLNAGQTIQVADLGFSGSELLTQPTNNLLLNDRDEPGQTTANNKLKVALVRGPKQAINFALNSLGGWQYTAASATTASNDSFSYTVSDGTYRSAEVQVHLSIKALSTNTDPTAANQCLPLATPGNSYTGQLASLVKDSDSSSFNYTLASNASTGSVDIDLSSGRYSYTPHTSSRGYSDYFVYQVDDLDGGTATGVVSLIYGASRLMPLGDSITFGVEGYTGATGDLPVVNHAVGYRKILRDKLVAAGYMVDFVGPARAGWDAGLSDADHAGFPGWRASELAYGRSSSSYLGNIDSWLNANPVDAVLIHAGTNDRTSNAGVLTPLLNKVQQWQDNHHAVEMYIASIVDQRRDGGNARTHLDAFNAGVEALVSAYNNATYVDQYGALDWQTDLSSYSVDSVGLHPNKNGYLKMANRWYASILQSGLLSKCP